MIQYKDLHLYKELHQHNNKYGNTGHIYAVFIKKYLQKYSNIATILDFGCGKGTLKQELKLDIDEYDPAIPGKETIPKNTYDLIITTDVLEHLYITEIPTICEEFLLLRPKRMLHFINTAEAKQILPDGTNAHKTIKNGTWWKNMLLQCTKYQIDIIYQSQYTVALDCYNE